jgi:TolB-like protein
MRIAIMDFQADGISRQEARRITDLIRTEIINTGKFSVIERNQLDKILKEQGFQQTGITDESSAVKVGKILSANKILVGSVMMLSGTIVINGRIVDVEKGVASFGEKQIARHSAEIYDAVIAFSQKLTKRIYKDTGGIEYHSPILAGVASVAPFWSGSMNTGFDTVGMSFVLGKSLLLISGILAVFEVWPVDAIDKEIYFVAFGAATTADIIYSSFAVARFNEKYGLSASLMPDEHFALCVSHRGYSDPYLGRRSSGNYELNVSATYSIFFQ